WYYEGIMLAKSVVSVLILLGAIPVASVAQAPLTDNTQLAQHKRMVQQYLREQRPDLAIPELKKIASLDPGNEEARANLGVLLFFRGEYADAVPQLRAAINIDSKLWKVQALLGFAEERMGDV